MSDPATLSDESGVSPNSKASTSFCNKVDPQDRSEESDIYKNNNNNNIEDPPHQSSRDVGNFAIPNQLGEDKPFKRRDSFGEDKNTSPKERERPYLEEGEKMECSPKSASAPSHNEGGSERDTKFTPDFDFRHHLNSLKRPFFPEEERDRDHLSSEFPRPNHIAYQGRGGGGGVDSSKLSHFINREQEQNEETSDNEMMCDEYESDSESNEPRITVREALMNRALAAAAAAVAGSTPHFPSGMERRGDTFPGDPGGSGRTSRSGGVSPSSSPGVRNTRQENSSKEPFVNGHSSLRPLVTQEEKYASQGHTMQSQYQQRNPFAVGAHNIPGHGPHSTGGNSSKNSQYRDSIIGKSERKSNSSSPLQQADVKPENLASLSNLSNIQSSIGNALLNLASLGSLAALQQSLPNLLSSVNTSTSNVSGSPSHTSPHNPISSPSGSSQMNAPLNLTHSSGTLPKSQHHHHQSGSNNTSSRNQHSSSPFPHQSAFTQCGSGSQSSIFPGSGGGGGIIPPNIAAYFQGMGGGGASGSGSSPFIPNNNSVSHGTGSNAQSAGSLPQLVLASGQIMQGIQGAQLLIPTSQGLLTQMILTIPLTQPGSPQSLLNTPAQNTSPAIGASSGQRSSSPHSRGVRVQSRSHHGLPQCSANSPPIASTVPPSASPDFSGPGGSMSGSLMNLSSHLVNQSLGAHIPLDKMGMDRSGMNGMRSSSLKRDNAGSVISPNPNIPMSSLYPPKMSPCSGSGHESDKCSDAGDSDQMVDGINLDEIKEFAKAFKLRRLSLGLTQTQVGQALSVTEGPAYSQSAICSALAWQLAQSQSQLSQSNRTSLPQPSMFEKLDITPKSAQKIKPVLERWMKEAEDRYKNGHQNLNEFVGMEPSKKRKRRTSFTPQALEILNTQFERNTHPSGAEITTLAHQLGYEREVIRIWFCNKRQALKNTVRMMSKGSSPI